MKKTVMLVEDDPSICKLLKAALDKNNYDTLSCSSSEEALKELEKYQIDAFILDIILPGIDGLELLKKIRTHSIYTLTPVIMLTSKDSEVETVLGLEMGADDYLSKPVRYHELITRLKKALAKTNNNSQPQNNFLSIHGIDINFDSRDVHINKTLTSLTFVEYELLALLAKNPGKVFTRDNLLDLLWHDNQFLETRTVDVHIRRLRKKIEEHGLNPNIIETIRSVGYRFFSTST